jgi:hypothetical protein
MQKAWCSAYPAAHAAATVRMVVQKVVQSRIIAAAIRINKCRSIRRQRRRRIAAPLNRCVSSDPSRPRIRMIHIIKTGVHLLLWRRTPQSTSAIHGYDFQHSPLPHLHVYPSALPVTHILFTNVHAHSQMFWWFDVYVFICSKNTCMFVMIFLSFRARHPSQGHISNIVEAGFIKLQLLLLNEDLFILALCNKHRWQKFNNG